MDTVFLAFANSNSDKLETLTEEDEKVNAVLTKRKIAGDIDLIREQYATTNRLIDGLFMYQKKLSIFLYSGHAGRDKLIMEDQDANAEGIAALLQQCPNIKLVVLNGCSTKGQVDLLLQAKIPIVIATSAPVGDTIATRFSIAFFNSLAGRMNNIQTAFEEGIAAAKVVSNNAISTSRGVGYRKASDKKDPLWGLYYLPENEYLLEEWRLGATHIQEEVFEPNKLLLDSIWEAIKPYIQNEAVFSQFKRNDKIDKIITELPHPISDYLRKLIASKRQGEENEFYNELGVNRLKYLIYTYTNSIDILAFTMLAQLWDELSKGKQNVPIPSSLLKELESLFSCNFRDRRTFSLLPLIAELRGFFEQHKIAHFIQEFSVLSQKFNEKSDLFNACTFIESIRLDLENNPDIHEQKAKKLCIDLEKNLAIILKQIGFLAKYKMASMKSIEFIKYKHNKEPRFRHNFVELRYRPSGMNIESETLENSMDNASVIFIHKERDNTKYLNLSPFIIDVNSFDEKAQLADICLFLSYEKTINTFAYRFVYKPIGLPLRIDTTKSYASIISEQMNAFHQLVFKKPIY